MHSRETFLFLCDQGRLFCSLKKTPGLRKMGRILMPSMGKFDSAEVSDLLGLYILNMIEVQEHVGLYRDDGLAVVQLGFRFSD